ncbi:MAG: hypothetical protein AW07_00993 [Candidatus Accumulibacter sp. SK-11]|nr:MAG: hypothetical protein AW07_00993 [Candidatus Accumulibacter sp. SK-11]
MLGFEQRVAHPRMHMLDGWSALRIGERLALRAAQEKGIGADQAEHGAHAVDVIGMRRCGQEQRIAMKRIEHLDQAVGAVAQAQPIAQRQLACQSGRKLR